jgi:hypothetical protein
MARAQETSQPNQDGMSLVTLMPFPALNPLNWWALAHPANAMRAAMHTTRLALDTWRAGADGMRALVRAQQDSLLNIAAARPASAKAPEPTPEKAAERQDAEAAAAVFVSPMLEVTRAYGRVGKAFIVAQRDTMRAFADAGKPH